MINYRVPRGRHRELARIVSELVGQPDMGAELPQVGHSDNGNPLAVRRESGIVPVNRQWLYAATTCRDPALRSGPMVGVG